jgi:hemoglobin
MRISAGVARATMLALSLLACACTGPGTRSQSLYDQFGGTAGLQALVDDLLQRFADDEQIAPVFAHTNIARFRSLFVEHLCDVVDGPCTYSGDDMQEVHRGLSIDEAQFNAVVEHLIDAMQARHIPRTAQNQLIARLAPMRKDIIYR